jgi:hypothetical protein
LKIDKLINELHKKLDQKSKEGVGDDYDIAIDAKFEKLREGRAKKIDSWKQNL